MPVSFVTSCTKGHQHKPLTIIAPTTYSLFLISLAILIRRRIRARLRIHIDIPVAHLRLLQRFRFSRFPLGFSSTATGLLLLALQGDYRPLVGCWVEAISAAVG